MVEGEGYEMGLQGRQRPQQVSCLKGTELFLEKIGKLVRVLYK